MLRLGAQSKRDEPIYDKLASVSVLSWGKKRFAWKQNLLKIKIDKADDVNEKVVEEENFVK